MKKVPIYAVVVLFSASLILSVQSCKKDTNTTVTEFIADSTSFAKFENWPLYKTYNGPDPLLGEMAHANNDATVKRDVYFKGGQNPVKSKYPIGTLIVKHSYNAAGTINEYTAMAKRGNNFNPENGDWEWFVLKPNGAFAADSTGAKMRGANLMNGMCISCHAVATTDYVFSK